jgi:hypothetical protein
VISIGKKKMIEEYKKYLVVGYLRFYNPSVYSSNNGYAESGPHAEEVWATDGNDAVRTWERKVIPWGSYCKESFNVEIKVLHP